MTQPHNPHAEQAVIGAALLAPQWIPTLAALLDPTALYNPHHHTIWTTITDLAPLGPIDPLTIARALQLAGQLERIGGIDYLHTCAAACPTPANAPTYIQEIHAHANTRALRELAARLNQAADQPPEARTTLLDAAAATLGHIAAGTRATLNGRHIDLQPAHLYRTRAVKWLWDTRIPVGTLTLISGREGAGKSIMLAWMAAAITNGNLPGIWAGKPRAVLYAATEDSWEYTISPRMLAAGANLNLVYRVDTVNPDGTHNPVNLPRDLQHLPDAVKQVDAAILMCDPLLSVLDDNVNVFKAQEVRTVLEPLVAVAEQTGIAVVGLAHFNKSRHADSLSMMANSRAFAEVARAAIAIARDDQADDYTVVLSQTKNNLGTLDLPSLLFTIDDVTLQTDELDDDGRPIDAHVGRLRWTGEAEVTADELLTGTAGDRPLSDTAAAILDWIRNQAPPVTVQEAATHFKETIRYETVKKTMARLAARGHLVSPSRGLYEPMGTPSTKGSGRTGKRGQKATKQPSPEGTPPYPRQNLSLVPTTPSQYIYRQVGGGGEREDSVSLIESLGTDKVSLDLEGGNEQLFEEMGVRDKGTEGTGDRHPPRESARAVPYMQAKNVEPTTLNSCKICHGPFEDSDGTGQHTTCPPKYLPPQVPEPVAALSDEDDEPEDWWKR